MMIWGDFEFENSHSWYHLALLIDNNDNDMTFFGNIVYLRPCSVICGLSALQMTHAGANKQYSIKKSCYSLIIKTSCNSWYHAQPHPIIVYYYTSHSLWKIWLVESIQSTHNSLWTWHDKCNIYCSYCIYHVKFKVRLVTRPLGGSSSETKWLNASLLFLRINYVKNEK